MLTRPRALLVIALVATMSAAVSAEERPQFVIVVGTKPLPVYRERSVRSEIVQTATTGTNLDVLSQDGGWYWVVLPSDANGTRRSGWVSSRAVRPLQPSTPQGETVEPHGPDRSQGATSGTLPTSAPTDDRRASELPTGRGPSDQDGTITLAAISFIRDDLRAADQNGRPAITTRVGRDPRTPVPPYPRAPRPAIPGDDSGDGPAWFTVRSLRGHIGGGMESVAVGVDAASVDEQGLTGLAGIDGSFSLVDPGILTINAGADIEQSSIRRPTMRTAGGFRNYRLEAVTRTGRNSPLHVFTNRTTAALDLRPLGPQDTLFGRTRGIRTSRGLAWSLSTARLPRIEFSAMSSSQQDLRDAHLGLDSTNRESRTTLRALDDAGRVRYDFSYAHRAAAYEVPQVEIGSTTSDDLLNANVRLTPTSTLAIDVNGRGSRYEDDVNGNGRSFDGVGGGAAVRWQFRPRWSAAVQYDFSTNVVEALLSGAVGTTVPGIIGPESGGLLRTRTLFQHGDGRVTYVTDSATIEVVARDITYGVPAFQPQSLSELRTVGGNLRGQRTVHGFDLGAGIEFALGTAFSNRSLSEPYRELGGQASVSRAIKQALRITAEGSIRRNGRLIFYPLLLNSDSAGLRFESQYPKWAKTRAAILWSRGLRDALDSAIREGHVSFAVGVSGGRYDLALDVGTDQSRWLQLPPGILGTRIEAAILMASRPELYLNVFGGTDQMAALTASVRPFRGFSLRARAIEQRRRYQGQYEWDLTGGQIAGTYQLRELQIEFGWERMDSTSLFYNTRDRRFYVRIRRDVTVF